MHARQAAFANLEKKFGFAPLAGEDVPFPILDADLSGYFDSIPHSDLLKSVVRRVVDGAMLHLIKMWLEAPVMIICDLSGEIKNCLQKEIEGKEYDICSECWTPLAQRLKGKGRPKSRETVFLPPRPDKEGEDEDVRPPLPGGPPKIWGEADRTH